jgi:hypothetical protein
LNHLGFLSDSAYIKVGLFAFKDLYMEIRQWVCIFFFSHFQNGILDAESEIG